MIVLALLLALSIHGCGDSGSVDGGGDGNTADTTSTESGGDTGIVGNPTDAGTTTVDDGGSTGSSGEWGAPIETNAWGLLFEFEARTQGSSENELWFGDGALGAPDHALQSPHDLFVSTHHPHRLGLGALGDAGQ